MEYTNDKLKLPLNEDIKLGFQDLTDLINVLLGENGCPWDKEQTVDSLKKYMLEECYEVLEAADNNDKKGLMEELGDLIFQVFFMTSYVKRVAISILMKWLMEFAAKWYLGIRIFLAMTRPIPLKLYWKSGKRIKVWKRAINRFTIN